VVLFGLDLTKSNSCFLLLNSFSGRNTIGNILCSYQLHPNNEMIIINEKERSLYETSHSIILFFLKKC
jgi:hypothetical protein